MERISRKLIVTLILLGALFTIGAGVRALSIRFTVFSDNLGYNDEFAIDGDYVVWLGLEEGHEDMEGLPWEDIYLYQISTGVISNLTDGEDEKAGDYPQIAGDYIVWDYYAEDGWEIHLHQISVGVTKTIAKGHAEYLNEEYIVYSHYSEDEYDVMLYEFETGKSKLIYSDTGSYGFVQVDGDYVVWVTGKNIKKADIGKDYELHLYQISTGIITQLTHNAAYDGWPDMDGDYVVWFGEEAGNKDVYLYQISTGITKKLTGDQTEDGPPKISGEYIVWSSHGRDGNKEKGTYLYQISKEKSVNISPDNPGGNYSLQIDGDYIVWASSDGDFLYKISEETVVRFLSSNQVGYYELNENHIAGEMFFDYPEAGMFVIEINEVEEPASLPAFGLSSGRLTKLPSSSSHQIYTSLDEVLKFPFYDVEMPIVAVYQFQHSWNIGWLSEQAGILTGGAFPSWTGNMVLAGHTMDEFNQPGPFALLEELDQGDEIQILADRQIYTYRVFESKAVFGNDIKGSFVSGDRQWITLFTSEYYDPYEKEYISRWMVKGKLVRVEAMNDLHDLDRNVTD